MLQSHAAVYCGDQSRSYHRTTIQLVQPNPDIVFNEDETMAQTVSKEKSSLAVYVTAKRKLECSPASSPHKLGKVGPKRPRTLTPRNLMDQLQAAKAQREASQQSEIVTETPNEAHLITMPGFQEQPAESVERKSLESNV